MKWQIIYSVLKRFVHIERLIVLEIALIYRVKCVLKNGLEDIKKAKWYIDKYIELRSGNDDT